MAKQKLVVLSGAGMSAESGLKTFRDSDGLWEGHNVTDVATPEAWAKDPQLVLDFYNMRRKNVRDVIPNNAHKVIASLEEHYDVSIITQNIDDLHERAGSSNVLHLHGEIFKMRSERNEHQTFTIHDDIKIGDIAPDGCQLRPAIVWFGEPVYMIETAVPVVQSADIFVVIGTSLVVYPAAGLVDFVGDGVTKYVIDKSLPSVSRYNNVIPIEQPATKGVEELQRMLLS